MRVLLFGNNRAASEAARLLRASGDELVGLVLHPVERRRFGDEILAAAGVAAERVFDASTLRQPETVAALAALAPEIGLSVYFGYILRPEVIALAPRGVVNLHPALLPFNRGAYPNVWSIVDGTPAGVTLHYIDAGVDTGDVIAQRAVEVAAKDTGASLYRKLEEASLELLRATWPAIRRGEAPRLPQPRDAGTAHRVRDVERIDAIDLERRYLARELIDVLRARTFPPHRGAYVVVDGRKIYLRLELLDEDEL